MSPDATLFRIGQSVMSRDMLAAALPVAVALLLLLVLLLVWRTGRAHRRQRRAEEERLRLLERQLAEMSGQLRQQAETASARDAHIARLLAERLDSVSLRVGQGLQEQAERTSEHLRQLSERLAVIDRAQATIDSLSGEVLALQRILSDKQARGAFGQARMEAIVSDALPASAYEFQPTLPGGVRPDCLIRLPGSDLKIVVDAKFPLEAFEALRTATGERERKEATQRLRGDVARHIRDISSKYLIPGETHETAIMFVPSESVYAEIHENHPDLVQKAHRARVVLASPNVLMLMIQTMQSLYRDARMREAAGVIRREVGLLLEDVDRLRRRALDLQRFFGRTADEVDRLLVSSEKIARRGERIANLELEETEETPET